MAVLKLENPLPGIEEYLETVENKKSVSSRDLEDFIIQVQIQTGLNTHTSTAIVKAFFSEIRNSMLRGDIVVLRDLGKFFISSPRNSKNKERVFPVFKPYKKMIRRLNDS